MKRLGLVVLILGVCAMAAAPAAAQSIRWGVGAGLLMPMGDYGEVDKMGFTAGVGGTYNMPGGLGIRADLSYAQTSHDGVDGNTKLIGGLASVVYAFGTGGARPYLTGGVGLYNISVDVPGVGSADETKVGFGFGGGVSFPMGTGGSRLFAETRFTSVSTSGSATTFLPIVVGISFGR